MKQSRASSGLLNLDVLALSLMCCLLASVVGVLVLVGEVRPPVSMQTSQDTTVIWTRLRDQTTKLSARVDEADHSREAICEKINYSALQRNNLEAESRIREIQQKLSLIDQIIAATREITRSKQELENLQSQTNPPPSSEAWQIVGKYKGPYVLIECVEDGANIYPGNRKLEMPPPGDQADQLFNQITNAGFVALVVRPGGWYGNSFDKLRKMIYDRLDQVETPGGRHIGRSAFPISDQDSIANYLPPDAKP
jgi:hypothetical protein